MNRIFKVIWSKTKHCYIVVSEYAKANTKAAHIGLRTTAAAVAAAAMLLAPVNYNYVWAADTATVTDTSNTEQTVYTQEGAEKKFATQDQLQADVAATNAEVAKKADQTALDETNANLAKKADQTALDETNANLAKKADQTALDETNANLAKKADQTALDETNANLAKKADQTALDETNANLDKKANAADVYSKTDADSKFATQDQLQADVSKTNLDLTNEMNERKAADTALDTRITSVKEYLQNETENNYVSKAGLASELEVKDAGVVKADQKIGENVTALGKALNDETAARIGADAAQDKVIQQVNDNLVQSVNTINKNVADGFTALNQADANEAKARAEADTAEQSARETADNELNERITNEANAIHDEIKAGDKALDDRITSVKEYLEGQTANQYVSKADAAVQDGAVVKAANTIGDNVTKLDAALAKETAARLGADAAQDKVIQQVNDNLVQSVNTINKNMADGFTALNQADANEAKARAEADAAETAGRVAADTKLVEATNSGLSIDAHNVLQKNITSIDSTTGEVTTSKEAATTLVMNEGNKNQITLSENGIKVGTGSTVIASDGVFAGGDTAGKAKAALNADGSIKGANGAFTVDTNGNVASGNVTSTGTVQGTTLTDGTAIMSAGNLSNVKDITATGLIKTDGNIKGHDITAENAINGVTITGNSINGTTGTFSGTVSAGSVDVTNKLTAGSIESTGSIEAKGNLKGDSLTVTNNASVGGQLSAGTLAAAGNAFTVDASGKVVATGIDAGAGTVKTTGAVETGTLKTTGDAEIGGDLTVKGKLNVDEIDLTKSGIVGDNNVTASTHIAAGEIKGYQKATRTKDGSETESAFDYDANGTSTWATSTAADKSWKKSTLSVEGNGVTSTAIDSNNNKNTVTQSADVSSSILANKEGLSSTFKQNVREILNEIHVNDTKYAKLDQKADNITSEVKDGDNTTSTTQTATNLTNTAQNGTITNDAKDLVNNASGNMTNTVGGNLIDTIMGTSTTTVTGNVTEDYKSDLTTKVGGNETHAVTGNQTVTVSKDRTVNVKGTETENFNAQVTNVKTDQKTSVGGNQTTIVTGNQQNTVSGNKLETVKGAVTEKYGSQATTIDGNQSTNVGGNQSNVVAGDQTNNISGSKTETVRGAVSETYGSQTTKVNGDQSTTVTGKQTNSITGDQVNTIGGNQTTTVTGDSSLSAKNITNTGTERVVNQVGSHKVLVNTEKVESAFGDNIFTTWDESGITNTATDKTVATNAKDIKNTATGDITNTAQNGTITNDAKNITNTATEKLSNTAAEIENTATKSIMDKVGENVSRTMSTTKIAESVVNGTQSNTSSKTAEKDIHIVSDGAKTSTVSQLTDSVNTSLKTEGKSLNNKKTVDEDVTKITDTAGGNFSSSSQKSDGFTRQVKNGSGGSNTMTDTATTSEQKMVSGNSILDIVKSLEDPSITSSVNDGLTNTSVKQGAKDITHTAQEGTITNEAKNLVNTAMETISNTAGTQIQDKVGTTTVTTTDGLTKLTNEAGTHRTEMDLADVLKDLGVRGNATVDGNTTLGKEGADTTLTVNSQSTFNNKVTIANGGLDVTGGTTTDTLHVTGQSTFDDVVNMNKDLNVRGNATVAKDLTVAGDVTARSYKVGDKTYIDENGINANGQKITHVAAGTEDGDAANYGQLRKVETRMDGVENRVTNVESRVDKMDSRIDKVGANAAAMANLHPLEFDEDSKWNVAAAVGNYKSETAAAVGAFYRPNEDVMFNLSTTFGNDENMVGGGLSLRLGKGGNHEKDKKLKAAIAENNDLRVKVDDLTARMDALLSVLNPNMSKEFPDVPENHWAYEAVTRLAGSDIVQGYEDGKFHGERTMTRYEMAEIIYNALSKGAKAEKKLVEEFRPELQAMAAQKQAK